MKEFLFKKSVGRNFEKKFNYSTCTMKESSNSAVYNVKRNSFIVYIFLTWTNDTFIVPNFIISSLTGKSFKAKSANFVPRLLILPISFLVNFFHISLVCYLIIHFFFSVLEDICSMFTF